MHLTIWHYIGIAFFILEIIWIIFYYYYYYATVNIYNFCEKNEYQYLGYLWVRKIKGEWYLEIPKEMIEESLTTKYKIISQSVFHKLRKGEKIYINFADRYHTKARLEVEITVENYIMIPNIL